MESNLIDSSRFPAPSREEWLALATKALKGTSFDEALVSYSDDGIRIDPLYERLHDPRPQHRAQPGSMWHSVQRVDDPDLARASLQAADDIANGATGLSLVFEGAPNAFGFGLPATQDAVAQVLKDLPLNKLHLRIDTHPTSRLSLEWLVAHLTERRADPGRLTLSFGIDPAALFAGTGRLRMSIEALLASMPQSLAHFFALGVPGVLLEADGRVCHNAGATEAQELGFMIASAASHLRMFEMARQPLIYAAPHIGFATAATQDQFLTMAKLRALRRLWTRVQEACSIEPSPARIHAETSWRMLAEKDPETNILRSTIAVFAAACGGADAISVLPHTYAHGLPDAFARRIARNTHLVLAQESHIDFVGDPAAGAGGVEELTDALCRAAWREFQVIEAEGGILYSLAEGKFQQRVRSARDERAEALRNGRRSIVGTTVYPAETERTVASLAAPRRPIPQDGVMFCEQLAAMRDDELAGGDA
ncbi:methylmalonyl-CoA mutase family protein [Mesorhizobium xinjiangense]|uniref:methylmalonyl-CoA mutase family protein n=1 Tax=Mesorhizobium xinjiangense TaxID=2678685 RepID=UPI0012EE2011|nr:methylmalonyl-CoA mutase family protein [Mesorhizobium xinjiangense]